MEQRKERGVTIAVVTGVITLLLGLCLGAAVGGVGGFLLGRQASERNTTDQALPGAGPRDSRPRALPELSPEGTPAPEGQTTDGVIVEDVVGGSPADVAGIKTGDIITEIDGQQLGPDRELRDALTRYEPGDTVELTLSRGNQTLTVTVELGARVNDKNSAYLGIRYRDLSSEPQEQQPAP